MHLEEKLDFRIVFKLVKQLCDEIEQYNQLIALRLEGNTINEEAATAIGKALEKHSEIQVTISIRLFSFPNSIRF